MKSTRRDFLKTSATLGPILATPSLWTGVSRAGDANSKLTVAAIGVGGSRGAYSQGGAIAQRAAQLGRMIAVCDVDDVHTAEFNAKLGGNLNMYRDYRVLFEQEKPDVVTIGTPDHWHVPIALTALHHGCDVYCEKPLTLTIEEGIRLRKAVEETGRVFQVGTQQRSENEARFLKAIAMVQSGRLGKNVKAFVAIGGGPEGGPYESFEAPADLDWDLWVGPSQAANYSPERRKQFRWYLDYSGGQLTDWGAHHIDIAQWALGVGHSGPSKVRGTGKYPPLVPENFDWSAYLNGEATLPDGYMTAMKFGFDLEYPNGAFISLNDRVTREDGTEFENGILFEGENGRIFVNRGRLTGKPVEDLTDQDHAELNERVVELYNGKPPVGHMQNFFDCIETREQPISDVASHHRTMTTLHICNIALMLGRELTWDAEKEDFIGDEQASALRTRYRRPGYGPTA